MAGNGRITFARRRHRPSGADLRRLYDVMVFASTAAAVAILLVLNAVIPGCGPRVFHKKQLYYV